MRDYEYHLYEEARAGRISRRELLRRGTLAGVSMSTMATLLAACGGGGSSGGSQQSTGSTQSNGPAQRGGTMRIGTNVPAADVDPVTMYNQGAIFTVQCACEYLVGVKPDYSFEGRLATKWQAVNNNAKTWEFNLRQGVKFHDGSAMTADDVVATFDRLTDKNSQSAALSAFKTVLSKGNTEKVDAHTVRFHLDRAYSAFPALVTGLNYNAVILPRNYQIGDFVKGGAGTGAFKLQKYTTKRGATFTASKQYWQKGKPYLNGIDLRYYDDNSAIALAIQGGAIDVYPQMPYSGSQGLLADPNIVVLQDASSAYSGLALRVDKDPWNDARVRRALALSLDRRAIIQGLFKGTAQVASDHPFAPTYPTQPTGVTPRRQDVQQAKQLMSQAGHSSGVNVTLTTENYLEIPQYAQIIQQQAKQAGFNIKLRVLDQTQYYGTGNNQPWLQVPMGITDWAPRGSAGQTIDPAYLCGGVWNSAHWCNKQFDQTIRQFEAELDQQKANQLAGKAANIMMDDTPEIISYWITELRSTRKNVNGLAKGPAVILDPAGLWLSNAS